ncbi:lysine--tRNA ligase [Gammaproteobacteria bacterium]|nr:lysine--tRNA ligase [Gammaproteobacteria bacterium]
MSDETQINESSILEERKKKLKLLRNQNKAYINNFVRKDRLSNIVKQYHSLSKDDLESKNIDGLSVAGRIVLKRVMGNASFITIRDEITDLQIYVSKNDIDEYDEFKTWDIGDIVGIKGKLFRTKTDELTIHANQAILITKSLKPMPEKHQGLKDVETRYRQRYLDLMSNNETKHLFIKRSKIIDSIRSSMKAGEYMEVETPMMHTLPGGAVARPFITKHNALSRDLYLRIAPELHLKRLLVGGFNNVFEINRSFRNEGLSTKHNPEFTMLEFYSAYASLQKIMDFVSSIIQNAALDIDINIDSVIWNNNSFNLKTFKQQTMRESIIAHNTDLKIEDLKDIKVLQNFLAAKKVKFDKDMSWGRLLLEIFENTVESNLIEPTFITEYPVEVSPLSRRMDADSSFVDRFELFICGNEIANGFCELNDPEDQAERFQDQVDAAKRGDKEAMSFDQDYITALEYGMPPAVGVGIGIDRLIMMLTNSNSIRDVLLFPQMKD